MTAFVVMHDTTMDALCRSRPATLAELRAVPGIGERKLEIYGRDLLQVIARYRAVGKAKLKPPVISEAQNPNGTSRARS